MLTDSVVPQGWHVVFAGYCGEVFEFFPGRIVKLMNNAVQVHQRYYPAIEQLIKQVSGASRVHVFDHTLRSGSVR